MRKILVIGGTRHFGRGLVERLIKNDDRVTIATRGNKSDDFGDRVERIRVDRTDRDAMTSALDGKTWDLVYDQVGFCSNDSRIALDAIAGNSKRVIFTSSMSIYGMGENVLESDCDTGNHEIRFGTNKDFDYAEGKRQAEAVYLQEAGLAAAAIRVPLVIGPNDPSERFEFHATRIRDKKPFHLPSPDSRISLITEEDAADFLFWAGKSDLTGAINISSGDMRLSEMMETIRNVGGGELVVQPKADDSPHSPYGIDEHWVMNTERVTDLGWTPKCDDLRAYVQDLATEHVRSD